MATIAAWSSYDGNLRVGRETIVRATDEASATIRWWVGANDDYNNTQRLTYGGSVSGYTDFLNDLSAGESKYVGTTVVTGSPGQTVTCSATLSGSPDASETPALSVTFALADVPGVPSAPVLSNVAQSSVKVSMTLPSANYSPITQTVFSIYDAATGGTLVASYTSSSVETTRVVGSLPSETVLYAETSVTNGLGTSTSSRTPFTTLEATAPDKPAVPVVSDIAETSCTATLTEPSINGNAVTGYEIYLQEVGGSYTLIETTDLVNYLEDLTIGTYYTIKYRAGSDGGYSEWTDEVEFHTAATVPDEPTDLVASTDGLAIVLGWLPPVSDGGDAITGYYLEVAWDAFYNFVLQEIITDTEYAFNVDSSYADVELHWRVSAINGEGTGAAAIGGTFTPSQEGSLYYGNSAGEPVRVPLYWGKADGTPVQVPLFFGSSSGAPVSVL